ncbi:phage protein NinX family protein [Enterobacter hormaechei]|uniref:phage protein NinX family protein n=1 Tax=Enterobacter hormaechei TaxID=158836 RepID=UPI003AB0E702
MDYSKLSDQEINMAIAEIFHPDSVVIESKSRPPCACITGHLPSLWVDYCNNPADAWPIIAESHIGIAPYPNEAYAWSSRHGMASDLSAEDKNPLRAAMIVFLMMQESANVPANSTGSDLR